MKPREIEKLAIKKAVKSPCVYKISALGFNRKGDLIGSSTNKKYKCQHNMGKHAEMELMKRYGKSLSTIIICRVNPKGVMLPISPCKRCSKMADNYGISISTLREI